MRNFILAPLVVWALVLIDAQPNLAELHDMAFQAAQPSQPDAPTLSEVDRLKIQNTIQRLQIAQFKAEAARAEFDKASGDFEKLLASLQKEGFTLDVQSLLYVPKKAEEKNPK